MNISKDSSLMVQCPLGRSSEVPSKVPKTSVLFNIFFSDKGINGIFIKFADDKSWKG